MQVVKRTIFVLSWLMILPASAYAQSALRGVGDSSGAVPGDRQASSSVLIEKSRTAVTDGMGRRILDLTPGIHRHILAGICQREA